MIVNSNDKSDAYTLAVLLFNQVRVMAMKKIGGWRLIESFTDTSKKHFITVYTNGEISARAESKSGEHTYTFGPEVK